MKILVANIGTTSFKFRLFEMDGGQRELASGQADRIGSTGGQLSLRCGRVETTDPQTPKGPRDSGKVEQQQDFADHGQAIAVALEAMVRSGAITGPDDLAAVAFKVVMAGDCEPVVTVDEAFLAQMERYVPVAPAHNPPYIAAMRQIARALPGVEMVAALETGFHRSQPPRRRVYAVPPEWARRFGVRRYGFHGASHRYIASVMSRLQPEARRIVSCHLGGSSSLCAIKDGKSQAVSMGLSPQTGLPQTKRAGDFDPFALVLLESLAGLTPPEVLEILGSHSGLAALSGTSGDMRDILEAASAGSDDAQLAFDVFTTAIRDYLGAYLVELGGADAVVFTGGIGQHCPEVRSATCKGLEFAGIVLDEAKNASAGADSRLEAESSRTAIWVVETNEESIVAGQVRDLLVANRSRA